MGHCTPGFDYYLAEFVSISVTALGCLAFPYIVSFLLMGKRRGAVTIIAAGLAGVVALLVYTVGHDVYFDRRTGKPLRYYADTPDGRQFSFTPGFEPRYGVEFQPYTREIAVQSAARPDSTPNQPEKPPERVTQSAQEQPAHNQQAATESFDTETPEHELAVATSEEPDFEAPGLRETQAERLDLAVEKRKRGFAQAWEKAAELQKTGESSRTVATPQPIAPAREDTKVSVIPQLRPGRLENGIYAVQTTRPADYRFIQDQVQVYIEKAELTEQRTIIHFVAHNTREMPCTFVGVNVGNSRYVVLSDDQGERYNIRLAEVDVKQAGTQRLAPHEAYRFQVPFERLNGVPKQITVMLSGQPIVGEMK